jgi:hypothetical protein
MPISYPKSSMQLPGSITLFHIAGARVIGAPQNRVPVYCKNPIYTDSVYSVFDKNNNLVVSHPSALWLPETSDEFRHYYYANDKVSVYLSQSNRTILIIEDRSPTYPSRGFIVFQRSNRDIWTAFQPNSAYLWAITWSDGSAMYTYEIVGVTDKSIVLKSVKGIEKIEMNPRANQ